MCICVWLWAVYVVCVVVELADLLSVPLWLFGDALDFYLFGLAVLLVRVLILFVIGV